MPLSDSRELTERPETDETDDAVDTERSNEGMAFRASEGVTQGSGEPARSGADIAVESSVAMVAGGDGIARLLRCAEPWGEKSAKL